MIPSIRAIFASDLAGGLGQGNTMPWPRLSADLKNFRELTTGSVVIMGRSTWLSNMPTPLPRRHNVVISHQPLDQAWPNTLRVSGTPAEIVEQLASDAELAAKTWWVIGGANILRQWLPWCQQVRHTRIRGQWPCDVVLDLAWQQEFTLDSTQTVTDGTGISLDLETWTRQSLEDTE
jgi:dihydrofolate reductase